jgi:hypothetical protein
MRGDRRVRSNAFVTVLVLVLFWECRPAEAASKVALVIGNKSYPTSPLSSSVDDAFKIDEVLRTKVEFTTVFRRDASLVTMRDALKEFEERAADADAVFIYYSGHGIQVDGHNYLVPVDADLRKPSEVPEQTLSLKDIFETLQRLPSEVKVVVVDACRDNSFLGQSTWKEGLADPRNETVPAGTSILLATGPNQIAQDGDDGGLSPFTKALAYYMIEPGLELRDIFLEVRTQVLVQSGGVQTPWEVGSPRKPFYFRDPPEIIGQILGGDDEVLVLVNGMESLSWNSARDTPKPIKLKAGRNDLTIKVFNQGTHNSGCDWIWTYRKKCLEGRDVPFDCAWLWLLFEKLKIPADRIHAPEGWNYHVKLFEKGTGRPLETFQDGEPAPQEKGPRHGKMFTVATATIVVDRDRNQISVEDKRDTWKNP